MRAEIDRLMGLGPFPAEGKASSDRVELTQQLITAIHPPVTDQEAVELVTLFGPDSFFGFAWTLLHLIETAPDWPIQDGLPVDSENEWVLLLRRRAKMSR